MKTIKWIIIILFLNLIEQLWGQKASVPIFEIKNDSILEQHIDENFFQILEDTAGVFQIEEIRQSDFSNKFHNLNNNYLPANIYWFRYRLKNICAHDINVALRTGADEGNFFIIDSLGNMNHQVTGRKVAWSKKMGIKQYNIIPILIKTNQEILVYYQRVNDFKGLPDKVLLTFYNTNKFFESKFINSNDIVMSNSNLYTIIFFSIFLLTAFIILILYWNTREKSYLYFSLFLFSLCFSNNPENLIFNNILLREHPEWNRLFYLFSLWPVFFIHFIRHYFQIFKDSPRLDNILSITATLNIFSTLSRVFLFNFDYDTIDIFLFLITIVPLLLSVFYFFKKHQKHANFFFIAILPLITIVILTYINTILGLPFAWLDEWSDLLHNISIGWMVIIIFLILFKKYATQQTEIIEIRLTNERLAKEKEIERNQLIESQKIELEKQVQERTNELSQSLTELKATQSQLIQKEKLASLGELTAGIAHEIQNPLNFVNNFSELSVDLVKDLKDEIEKPDIDKEYVGELFTDLSQNQEKINHHGKRASSIVKGMLEHSRASTGVKELTDINKLADEYLRLAYHGMRAKDKDFNADFTTDFDENLPKIEVIPQDIGRVLLNLINNAFYAVKAPQPPKGENYVPTVSVSTHLEAPPLGAGGAQIVIKVKDNGTGMPESVRAKVFQPFFTTKPTGQGTGLGLSLAYDIVTKGHGGTLEVVSTEGVSSEFIITLPFKTSGL